MESIDSETLRLNEAYNKILDNSHASHGSVFTENDKEETIYLLSFYSSVNFNSNYFDNSLNIKMHQNKPFICCSTISFDKNNKILSRIYPGNPGERIPCFGYIISQHQAEIIATSLHDSWTNKDTFNPNLFPIEHDNLNDAMDTDMIIDILKKEAEKKNKPLTKFELDNIKKNLNNGEYIRVDRIYNGRTHTVYVNYNAISKKKTKDVLKQTRDEQKKRNLNNYTEDTTSTNHGTSLKTVGMMIELDRVKSNFGDNYLSNTEYKKNISNVILFLIQKECDSIGIIEKDKLNVINLATFVDKYVPEDIREKYFVDNDGRIQSLNTYQCNDDEYNTIRKYIKNNGKNKGLEDQAVCNCEMCEIF